MYEKSSPINLSVIIPVRDDPLISRCIDSIDAPVESVIVLNTPSEQVRAISEELSLKKGTIVTEIARNNLAEAYNAGIAASSRDNILLMNSDCTFDPGTISKLYIGLEKEFIAKGKPRPTITNLESLVVAKSRDYHCGDLKNAYSPPLAFRKSISELIGGYYYNPSVPWTEDHEFNQRVQDAGLNIYYDPSATIQHAPLDIKTDLRSAFRYGAGQYEGIKNDATKPDWRYGGSKTILGSVAFDIARAFSLPVLFVDVLLKKGFLPAVYMSTLWTGAFTYGYYSQALSNVLGVERGAQNG